MLTALFGARYRAYSRPDAAYRLLQTAFLRRADATPSSSNPRRDGGQDLLPFLTRQRLLPCGSGDARRAALRPSDRTPLPVPPGCPGLPDLDARPTAPPTTCLFKACRSVVTIDAHVPKDRVKDPSCRIVRGTFEMPSRPVHAFGYRMLTRFPSCGALRATVVVGACALTGRVPCERRRTDRGLRSTGTPRRVPTSRRPGCLPP